MSAKFQKPHLLGLTAAAILCLLFSNPVVAGGNPSDEAEAYASLLPTCHTAVSIAGRS